MGSITAFRRAKNGIHPQMTQIYADNFKFKALLPGELAGRGCNGRRTMRAFTPADVGRKLPTPSQEGE